jgi:hypothetical protein
MWDRISDEFSELGLCVVHSKVTKSKHIQPFGHFGRKIIKGEIE